MIPDFGKLAWWMLIIGIGIGLCAAAGGIGAGAWLTR